MDTARRWCRTGALHCIMLADRAGYRIRQEDLDHFIAAHTHGGGQLDPQP